MNREPFHPKCAMSNEWTWWPAWAPCWCGDHFWCRIHGVHAEDCDCEPIEEWTVDPYEQGGPTEFIDDRDRTVLEEAAEVRAILEVDEGCP